MDFGLLYELAVPRPWHPRSEYQRFWDAIAQVKEAERVGFTHAWAVEHHFREEFSHMGAPEVWLSAVAQHTSTIRLGHGIVLLPLPFNHPIRVAERIAMLDILSNGRVEFGTGRSIKELELDGFGVSLADTRGMWEESVAFLQNLWAHGDEPIEFHGTYLDVPPRKIFPRPLQQPHPPMWMAATSPMSYALAGDWGLGVLGFGMAVDKDAMGRRLAEWRTAMDQTQRPIASKNRQAAVFMMGFCAPTEDEARAACEDAFVKYLDVTVDDFIRFGDKKELPPGYEWYVKAGQASRGQSGRKKFDYLYENKMILVGTPDSICETIHGFESVAATQMLIGMTLGTIPHEKVMQSIRLFGEAVIPNFRTAEVSLPA